MFFRLNNIVLLLINVFCGMFSSIVVVGLVVMIWLLVCMSIMLFCML